MPRNGKGQDHERERFSETSKAGSQTDDGETWQRILKFDFERVHAALIDGFV
jgi:hypothetical protein